METDQPQATHVSLQNKTNSEQINVNPETIVGMETKPPPGVKGSVKRMIRDNALILTTLLGIVVGFGVGFGLQSADTSESLLLWIGFPGHLFLRALRSTIVPLVVCMVITVTSSVDPSKNGRMAAVAIIGFYGTAVLGIITAIVLFLIFRPEANSLSQTEADDSGIRLQTEDVFMDLVRNIVPDNIIDAAISQTLTEYVPQEGKLQNITAINTTLAGLTKKSPNAVAVYERTLKQTRGVNILGLITICAAFGAAAQKTLTQDSVFLTFFRQSQNIILHIMSWLAWTTPFGVASLVAESIAEVEDLSSVFFALGRLIICVVVGLTIHQMVILPAIYFIIVRQNPFLAIYRTTRAFFVSFAATATSVAMPDMLEACRQNGLKERVSNFVIPMSITLHADGSALYIASASFFVAQTGGQDDLDLVTILIIGALTSVIAMAIPPVPSAAIVNIIIILTALDYPIKGISLLYTVEWFLDRLRTGVNCTSHIMVACYTNAICEKKGEDDNQVTSPSSPHEVYDMEILVSHSSNDQGHSRNGKVVDNAIETGRLELGEDGKYVDKQLHEAYHNEITKDYVMLGDSHPASIVVAL